MGKSRQGGCKCPTSLGFLYSVNFFPQTALASPNEKNQKEMKNIKGLSRKIDFFNKIG